MIDRVNRVLTGQTAARYELIVAGIIVFLWIAIDVHQYISFLMTNSCNP